MHGAGGQQPVDPRWREVPLPYPETMVDILAAWTEYGLASGHSDRTTSSRVYTVRRLIRSGVDPLTADRDELTRWLAGLEAKRSSKATYRAQIRSFYQWMVDSGRRLDDPSARLPRPRTSPGLPRPLTPGQVDAILRACAHPSAAQTRAYVILAAYAGLRVHEVAQVRGEHIYGDELVVLGKGGREGSVPMHPRVARLADTMPDDGWWFPSPSASGHVHRCSVSAAIKRAMIRADVAGTPHALRHHYGTQVLRASGGNLRTAQRALRHANITTTAVYTQIADDALRSAIAGIPAA